MTPEQIQALIAAGVPPAQIASMMSATAAPAPGPAALSSHHDPLLAGIRSAPPPTQAGVSFVDDHGKFDGNYRVRVKRVEIDIVDKGKILRSILEVLESSNMNVAVGSEREYPLFLWNRPALADAQGWLQLLSDAKGNVGAFTDSFYAGATGEANICAGVELMLSVFTKQQKRDSSKSFTHHRFSQVAPAAAAVRPAATIPPSVPGGSAFAIPRPPGYPETLPWPPV